MTAETVLIAAFSARALAVSARRAGFIPLAVDCFGDIDTELAAEALRCLPARVQTGFMTKPLFAALDELVAAASSPPLGLVLGSGFECNPRLVARLGERFRLLGNSAATIARTKDPAAFFAVLSRLGIVHPETRPEPPSAPEGWLMKRIGGSGGLHIVDCPEEPRPDPRRYFQRRIPGEAISILGLVGPRAHAFAPSRQWVSPLPKRPYRYGGAVGGIALEPDLEARLITACIALADDLGLEGLVSFDFLVADGEAALLEVNPRPGATLDVFDDAAGTLFRAHVETCLGGDGAALLAGSWRPPHARATAILYADLGELTAPALDWPGWVADRPRPGTRVGPRQPAATVLADADTPAAAEHLAHERLGVLANMLYEDGKNGKGMPQ